MYHYHPGENLEALLEQVPDPHERAELIDEAFLSLGELAVEPTPEPEEHIVLSVN